MKTRTTTPRRAAFSLSEIVVTIAIIGVMAALAIPIMGNVNEASKRTVAGDHVESLNRAVANFAHACWKLPTAVDSSSATDELLVVRTLQWKFPASSLKVGSPYFDTRYDPVQSSSTSDYRIRWNGRSFELLDKGQSGTGLRYRGGSDFKTPYVFPSGYTPEGG